MCRCTWLCRPGSRMGMGKPANIAEHVEPAAACIDAVVSWRPKLRLERARRLVVQHVIRHRRRATQSAPGPESHTPGNTVERECGSLAWMVPLNRPAAP